MRNINIVSERQWIEDRMSAINDAIEGPQEDWMRPLIEEFAFLRGRLSMLDTSVTVPMSAYPDAAKKLMLSSEYGRMDHFAGYGLTKEEEAALRAQIEAHRPMMTIQSDSVMPDAAVLAADDVFVARFLNALAERIHAANVAAGWWTDIKTGESILHTRNVPEMLCLIHSEVSEAMEGHRKNLMDDKLPKRPMLQVELADAIIRILDLAGSRVAIEQQMFETREGPWKGLAKALTNPIGDIMIEKIAFNRTRLDHQIENRLKDGGKKI